MTTATVAQTTPALSNYCQPGLTRPPTIATVIPITYTLQVREERSAVNANPANMPNNRWYARWAWFYITLFRVTNAIILKYNIVGRVTHSNILLYNIRKRVIHSNILLYNIRKRVSKSNILLYNIRARIVKSNILLYNIRKRVIHSNILLYNIRKRVIHSNILLYNIRKRVTKASYSIDFNNTTTSKVAVSYNAVMDVTIVTISAWVKLRSLPSTNNSRILHHSATSTTGYALGVQTTGKISMLPRANTSQDFAGNTALTTGQWYHIIGWYDATAGNKGIDINNVNDITSNTTDGPLGAAVFGLWIGNNNSSSSSLGIDGQIDRVKIFNKTLSPAQKTALYKGIDVTDGIIASWNFNEGTGTTANDSVNGLTGTLQANAVWSTDTPIQGTGIFYNIIGRVTHSNTLLYNIRKRVIHANTLLYNIRKQVKRANTLLYNIRQRVTHSDTLLYNIRKRVVHQNILLYNIRKQVTKSNTLLYNIRSRVARPNTLLYNIIGRVTHQNILKYNIRQQITRQNTLKYNILQRITHQNTLLYNIRQRVSNANTLLYNIRQQVTKSNILKYNILQRVTHSNTILWNIYADFFRVAHSLTLKYNIVGRVTNPQTLKYNIRQQVRQQNTLLYNIRQRVTKQATLLYNIQGRVTRSFTLLYNIVGPRRGSAPAAGPFIDWRRMAQQIVTITKFPKEEKEEVIKSALIEGLPKLLRMVRRIEKEEAALRGAAIQTTILEQIQKPVYHEETIKTKTKTKIKTVKEPYPVTKVIEKPVIEREIKTVKEQADTITKLIKSQERENRIFLKAVGLDEKFFTKKKKINRLLKLEKILDLFSKADTESDI